jgi:hypothetical protein
MAVPLLVLAWLLVGCGEITRSNPFDPHGTAYSGGSEMANSNGGGSASSSAVGGSASSSSLPIVYDTLMFDDLSGRAAAPANANLMKGGAWHLPIDLTTNNIVFSEDTVRVFDIAGTRVTPFAGNAGLVVGERFYGTTPSPGIGFAVEFDSYAAGSATWAEWNSGTGYKYCSVGVMATGLNWLPIPGFSADFRMEVELTCTAGMLVSIQLGETIPDDTFAKKATCTGARQSFALGLGDFAGYTAATEPDYAEVNTIQIVLKVEPSYSGQPFPAELVGQRKSLAVHKFAVMVPASSAAGSSSGIAGLSGAGTSSTVSASSVVSTSSTGSSTAGTSSILSGSSVVGSSVAPSSSIAYDTLMRDDFSNRLANSDDFGMVQGTAIWKMALDFPGSAGASTPYTEDSVKLFDRAGTQLIPFDADHQPNMNSAFYGGQPDSGIGLGVVFYGWSSGNSSWWYSAAGVRAVTQNYLPIVGFKAGFRLDLEFSCTSGMPLNIVLGETVPQDNFTHKRTCTGGRQTVSLGDPDFDGWTMKAAPNYGEVLQIAIQLKVDPVALGDPFPAALEGVQKFLHIHKFLLRVPKA